MWTKAEEPDKTDAKGIESVRRDNCPMVSKLIDNMVKTVLRTKNLAKMVELVRDKIQALLLGEVDMAELIVSKSLQKEPAEYDPIPPHACLALKMAKRDPLGAPRMGDRVPFIMVSRGNGKNIKTGEKAEDPIWAIEHGSPIDVKYYLEQQLYKPVKRILDAVMPGCTDVVFSMVSNTIYVPPNAESLARRGDSARKSTGSTEVVKGMADIEELAAKAAGASAAPAPGAPVAPPPAPPKLKAAPKMKKGAKMVIPGQMSLDGVLLRDPKDPANKRAKRGQPELPILPGQRALNSTDLLKPMEHKVTDERPDYIPVKIRYRLAAPRPAQKLGFIGKYGYMYVLCFGILTMW